MKWVGAISWSFVEEDCACAGVQSELARIHSEPTNGNFYRIAGAVLVLVLVLVLVGACRAQAQAQALNVPFRT